MQIIKVFTYELPFLNRTAHPSAHPQSDRQD